MADLEKSPIIQFRTDDSGMLKAVGSVKELKLAISQLKDDIVKMRQSGQDTTQTVTQLQAAQRELNTVMGLTKKGVDGVEGSYDNLVAKLREAKAEWRALPQFINGELNPAWEKARLEVEQYNTQLKNMDASVGVFTRNVGNYKSALEGFSGTMGQAAQIGGDFKNGLTAMSSMLIMAGYNTEGMNDAMKALTITVGILQGTKGLSGLIGKITSYIKESAKSVTATKADTTAKNANAAANTTMAAAEGTATVATTALGVALKALGIGLIVSAVALLVDHLEDIAGWLTGIGEKLGLIKKKGEGNLSTAEKTKEAYEKEKDELDKQVRIMQAKGKSQRDILKFQIQQIEASIKTKEAELESAKATLERLKQHNWLQRVLHGEQKEYKEIKNYIEEATAEIKEQKKTLESTRFDLELEGYREQTEAAKKAQTAADKAAQEAARKAAEALKKSQEIIKKGADEATKAIQKQETEVQKLDREYAEQSKLIEDAIAETRKLSGTTADVKLLEDGLVALKTDYFRKRYEATAAEKEKEIAREVEKQFGYRKLHEETQQKLLGSTNTYYKYNISISAKEKERVALLRAQVASIEEYLRTAENISDIAQYSGKTREELEKELKEPAITALLSYFGKSAELKAAEHDALASLLISFEDAFNKAISDGDFTVAEHLMNNFFFGKEGNMEKLWEETGILNATAYFEGFEKALLDAKVADPVAGLGTSFFNYFQGDIKSGFLVIDHLKERIEELKKSTEDWAIEELLEKEEELYKKRLEIFSIIFRQQQKIIDNYGVSTGKVLKSVADLWEAELQAKVKNGKKTEEEAKKSFKAVKALQISTAVINTAAAVVQALADTTVPSFYVKAANAAAAGIAGAAEIVKIASTDFSSSSSYSQSNTSAPTLTQSAPMVNTYGINPADYAEANAQNPVRVYVVESDITEAQNASRVRVAESTF